MAALQSSTVCSRPRAPGFNNLLTDSRVQNRENPLHVDFVKHAEAMGAKARRAEGLADLEDAMKWAQGNDGVTVISIVSDAWKWVPGDADWDVGVPAVSSFETVRAARAAQEKIREAQRLGV